MFLRELIEPGPAAKLYSRLGAKGRFKEGEGVGNFATLESIDRQILCLGQQVADQRERIADATRSGRCAELSELLLKTYEAALQKAQDRRTAAR